MSFIEDSGNGRLVSAKFESKAGNDYYELYRAGNSKTYQVSRDRKYGKVIKSHLEAVIYKYLLNHSLILVEMVRKLHTCEDAPAIFESTRLCESGRIIISNIKNESKIIPPTITTRLQQQRRG